MVEPAKNRMRDDVSEPLDRACAGRVLPKRNVSSPPRCLLHLSKQTFAGVAGRSGSCQDPTSRLIQIGLARRLRQNV
jgi:hypothetical protein